MRILACLALLIALPLQAASPESATPVTRIPAAGPGHAAIASAYPLASDAGKEILAKMQNLSAYIAKLSELPSFTKTAPPPRK